MDFIRGRGTTCRTIPLCLLQNPLSPKPSASTRARVGTTSNLQHPLVRRSQVRSAQGESATDTSRNWYRYAEPVDGSDDDDGLDEIVNSADGSDEDEADWLDETTLIAPFREEDFESEEDRVLAIVEYLQVPMQEKSQEIKQEIYDQLICTISEIRRTHQKLERGADVAKGKGIVIFNDACDKRHVDTSRAHAEIRDIRSHDQAELKRLIFELNQAYARRDKLWVDLELRINEIAKLQAGVLDQLGEDMDRAIDALEKKGKALLKDDVILNKEKLLRGVLGKL